MEARILASQHKRQQRSETQLKWQSQLLMSIFTQVKAVEAVGVGDRVLDSRFVCGYKSTIMNDESEDVHAATRHNQLVNT
jgi:hypothetical protein